MNDSTRVFSGFLSKVCGLLFISYLFYFIFGQIGENFSSYEDFSNKKGLISLIGLISVILSIPANIFTTIMSYLFGFTTGGAGVDSSGEVWMMAFLAILTAVTGLHATSAPIGHWFATAASYFVHPERNGAKPTQEPQGLTTDPETVKEETTRQKKAADLTEALREMERAKAKLDEFKRRNRS